MLRLLFWIFWVLVAIAFVEQLFTNPRFIIWYSVACGFLMIFAYLLDDIRKKLAGMENALNELRNIREWLSEISHKQSEQEEK
jgi:hypothetical protein